MGAILGLYSGDTGTLGGLDWGDIGLYRVI